MVKVLHGKVPEQDLRSLFETSACDRAKPGPIILPHPNGRDEDWTPAPQLPPTPQPLPPPNHGPYERQPETPRRSQGVADVVIFGWPALRGKLTQIGNTACSAIGIGGRRQGDQYAIRGSVDQAATSWQGTGRLV